MSNKISVDDVIATLNELVKVDAKAIARLITTRAPCNKAMTNHPTVQVLVIDGESRVGFMGVLNALFGTTVEGGGFISAKFDAESGELLGFGLYGAAAIDPGPEATTDKLVDVDRRIAWLRREKASAGDRRDGYACDKIDDEIEALVTERRELIAAKATP